MKTGPSLKSRTLSAGERGSTLAAVFLAAGSGPLLLVAADAGYGSLHDLGLWILLPSIIVLILIAFWSAHRRWTRLTAGLKASLTIGILATLGLDVVREVGFRLFHTMPGDISMLIGVLLTDRFMQGPDPFSNGLGELDHLWNGVTLAAVFILIFGRQKHWVALVYALLVAIGFMTSPVVDAIGVGLFGKDFGPGFALTVILAHLVFGLILGTLSRRVPGIGGPLWKRFPE